MQPRHTLLFTALLLTAAPAGADTVPSPDQHDPAHFIPPPPAAGSPRAIDEVAELKRLQAAGTPEQFAAAAYDDKHEDGTIFAAAIGPAFDPAKLPATAAMLRTIADVEEHQSDIAKKEFHRDRPWIVDPAIKTCTPHKPGPAATSYPSGHATVGFAMGVVLASLIPDKGPAIMARSDSFAENRLLCGYHFRSDIAAGQQFGTALAMHLMHDPQFEKQMAASKIELRAAHLGS